MRYKTIGLMSLGVLIVALWLSRQFIRDGMPTSSLVTEERLQFWQVQPAPALEDLQNSVRFWEQRLIQDPQDWLALRELSERLMLRFRVMRHWSDWEKAQALNEKLLNAFPQTPGPYLQRVALTLAVHDFPQAEAAAQEALRLNPGSPSHSALFDVWLAQGRYSEAQALLPLLEPHSLNGMKRQANFYDVTQQFEKAIPLLQEIEHQAEAAAMSPLVVASFVANLGSVYARSGQWSQALAAYERALWRFPRQIEAWEGLGTLAYRQDHAPELARRILEVLVTRGQASPFVYATLSQIESTLGHSQMAAIYQDRFEEEAGRWRIKLTQPVIVPTSPEVLLYEMR